MNSKIPFAILSALLLGACGDTVENINQVGMGVVTSEEDLPKCTDDNEGEQAFVKGEDAMRICIGGKWKQSSPSVSDNGADFSCKTVELKNKSGLKIVCNGDSIGVVLNGKDGEKGDTGKQGAKGDAGENGSDGKAGVGCSVKSQTDSTVTVACGTDEFTINTGNRADPSEEHDTNSDEGEADSLENISISGACQKGPFLSGTIVTAYELENGRSLKQTGSTFGGDISGNDGRFNIRTVSLKSSYAYLVVDGFYRNEVTGKKSTAPIKLRALTSLNGRSTTNINLLTHIEYDRVAYLVTKNDKSVVEAKLATEKEIFNIFHIDNSEFKGFFEDFNIFSEGDANAALLAISIMLQGDRSEAELTQLLTNISTDISHTGIWSDSLTKAEIADWAMKADILGNLKVYRKNVESWELGETVPNFEKYIRMFWATEKMGACSEENEGEIAEAHYQDAWTVEARCSEGEWTLESLADERDGQFYRTMKIGSQHWMAENLKFDYKVNGTSYGTYINTDNGTNFGRYYTWAAAMDSAGVYSETSKDCGHGKTCTAAATSRGICPEGWHIPTNNEWDTLYTAIGSIPYAMQAMGYETWSGATDAYAFSALPAGYYNGGQFYYVGANAYFWSATERNDNTADIWSLEADLASRYNNQKQYGFSVRCLKD